MSRKIVVVEDQVPIKHKPRFLIIEDNWDFATTLAQMLIIAGYEVEVTTDGPSGLLKATVYNPDIILLDIGLPGLSGFDLAKRIREAGLTNAHIVAVTGYGAAEDIEKSKESGIDYHIVKPLDPKKLQAIVGRYLEERFLK